MPRGSRARRLRVQEPDSARKARAVSGLGARADGASRAAEHERVGRHIAGDRAAGADQRILTDGHATHDGRVRADTGASLDQRGNDLPVVRGQQFAGVTRRPRIAIVGEANVGADKGAVLDPHTGWDEGEGLDLDVVAQHHAALDLHERGDFAVVANGAAVQIDELGVWDDDVVAEANVRRDHAAMLVVALCAIRCPGLRLARSGYET